MARLPKRIAGSITGKQLEMIYPFLYQMILMRSERYMISYAKTVQNFPGQFRHVARVLADDVTNRVVAIGDMVNIKNRPLLHPRIQVLGYESNSRGSKETHHYIRDFEGHIRRGQHVFRLAMQLKTLVGKEQ